ncbi:putative MFS efflux transporter [Aspergillus saccharolyticus JOP 1030-1]|uniref:MFS efflux transporter n=1 Tax=Aspergillus saccharolyticus JOP 1030-1 TaxID=1450539 RepID=A0A318ZAU5_9EURO|nr:MFS efflux transporter [Aspergillus saccharolyticus JOP 1030-1]PYH44561.1 MFS efflux transporter [Aspergillus saccharolyticus JOP 1030-1]
MAASAFGALVEFQSSPSIASPAAVVRRDKQGIAHTPSDHELVELQQGSLQPATGVTAHTAPEAHTSITPGELESHSASPGANEAYGPTPTFSNPSKTRWRFMSACLMNFAQGLNDSAPGALIPYMEEDYNIGYAVVSLIFVTNALGFILAALVTHVLETKFGRAKCYSLSMVTIAAGFVIIICKPPFPAVVASFFLLGLGMAICLALNNVYCANLANSTAALGGLHGSYGIGGIVGPLAATAMASHGVRWSLFYCINLAMTLFNLAFTAWSFWHYEKELPAQLIGALNQAASQQTHGSDSVSKSRLLQQAIKNRTTLLGALFIFAYQGAEVSISGWVVSFLISYRQGDPSHVGYVSAGFWAGITVGRFFLSHPAHYIGEKLSVVLLVIGSIAFQLMTWLIPNIIGDAVAVAIVGLLLGPVYPCATAVFSRLLPRSMQTSSLSFISAMGSSGGAVSPFCTGLLAQKVGTYVLHPICVGLYGVMLVGWMSLPRVAKRSE